MDAHPTVTEMLGEVSQNTLDDLMGLCSVDPGEPESGCLACLALRESIRRASREAGWSKRYCPDGGKCHHKCEDSYCFRVRTCGPLSNVYPEDRWPDYLVTLLSSRGDALQGEQDVEQGASQDRTEG